MSEDQVQVEVSQVGSSRVTITETETQLEVKKLSTSHIVTATARGPQGPQPFVLHDDAKVNLSVLYYDASNEAYRADNTWTISTIVKGGSF